MLRRTRVIMDAYLLAGPHSLCLQTGETALHVAAYHGNHEIVEYLLSIGSSPFVKNKVRGCQGVEVWRWVLCTLTQDCPLCHRAQVGQTPHDVAVEAYEQETIAVLEVSTRATLALAEQFNDTSLHASSLRKT